ncbi:glycosyltransferase family 2 protein [Streptomyces sp. WAC 06783]|uniref:glycosyltransferase family 2 protein n=1 Tax=Streptomyces sp. WAC 06783 TaxID=2203211 RepID=UPI0037DD00B3
MLSRHAACPDITIIIATQLCPERLDYLRELHHSLTQQTVPWEAVLAVDGADPARVPSVLADDPRVRVLALPRAVGAAAARNLALTQVRTKFVAYADDDDLLPADSLAVRHQHLTATGLGWVAGWSADLLPDGTTRTWICPTPPGRHAPGNVWTYWASPSAEIPLGQTMLLAHTELVRAAGGHGGLPQAEDFLMANGVTTLAAGELLPHVVYFYRKHPHQMTRGAQFDTFEGPAREFAFRHGQQLRAALAERPRVTSDAARS